jgi:hypothetical protein
MVQNMTLLEKVNVTTGVGWSMGLCVGNTGVFSLSVTCNIILIEYGRTCD